MVDVNTDPLVQPGIYTTANTPITINSDSVITIEVKDKVHPLYSYLALDVVLALKTTWNDFTHTLTIRVDFPPCSTESDLLELLAGLPTPGQTLVITKSININGMAKLSNDADGLSYSDLCEDVTLTFIPSVTAALYE